MNLYSDDTAPSSLGRPSRQFVSTYWPLVRSASQPGPRQEEALNTLIRQYAPALKHFLQLRFGLDASAADDLVQGFLLHKVLKRDLLQSAAGFKGKFRVFLRTAIFRWAIDQSRLENARKRIPPDRLVDLEKAFHLADDQAAVENSALFDRVFLRQVLAKAIQQLHATCQRKGHDAVWTIFYHRVLAPALGTAETRSYEELVAECGLASHTEARNRLLTAKRIFKRELEKVVEEYLDECESAEEELHELRKLLKG